MATSSMSKGFFEFVKSIGEAKSKQEEDKIIAGELEVLKIKMAGKNVASRQMREYLIRMVYVEMLGHDASFGHIHAVKLTRARKLVDKRVGYMACSLCLHKDHELMLLLVGGLQTDLQSQNQLEAATALIVACKLINTDTIPAVLPLVTKLLSHSEASIRKKAIMTLHRFWELNPSCITDIADKAKRMLCDKDPSVMGSSLHLLNDLMEQDANQFKDLVSSFVSILKQIIEHRLPKDYDYHRMPAPWIQIRLLQILAHLGQADKTASEGMYEVLHEVMRRADIGINVGYAIIYECVRTVTTIYPNAQLLAEAAKCTSRFITSDNHNLKYLGINALASIVQVNPNAAKEHQMVVIDCLEDKDETLRRKTLDLLYRMTNDHNVKVICMKFLVSLKDSVDVYLRQELIEKITSLAEANAPDPIWYIETMTEVFELGGELVQEQIAHNFIKHMALGIEQEMEEEEENGDENNAEKKANVDIAQYVADFFLEKLEHVRIPNILLKVSAWVLGEYGHLATGHFGEEEKQSEAPKERLNPTVVICKLWEVIEKQGENYETRMWAMSATCKLIKHLNPIPAEIVEIIEKYQQAINSDLQQLAAELLEMIKERQMLVNVFASSNITDEINVDDKLSFLDKFVNKHVQLHGGRHYSPPSEEEKGQLDPFNKRKDPELIYVHKPTPAQSLVEEVPVGPITHSKTLSTLPDLEEEQERPLPRLGTTGIRQASSAQGRWTEAGYQTGDGKQQETQNEEDEYPSAPVKQPETVQQLPKPVNEPPPVQPIKKVQEQPKQPKTKEQQLAEAIFNEKPVDPSIFGKRPLKKKPSARTITTTTKVSTTKAPTRSTNEEEKKTENLIDLDFGTTTKPTTTTSKPSVTNTSGADLLDDILGPSTITQTSTGTDTLDFLSGAMHSDDISGSTSTKNMPLDDIFGSISSAPSSSSMGSQKRGFAALPDLKAKIGAFPRKPMNDELLSSSVNCQVTYFKVYKQQQTSLCLFIANVSSSQLTNMNITITLSSTANNLQVGFDVSNSVPKPKLLNSRTAMIDAIPANQTIGELISIGAASPLAVQVPVNLNLTISYQVGIAKEQLNAMVAVNGADLMRPCILDTATFGKNWLQMAKGEIRIVVTPSTCSSLSEYVSRIGQLQLHHIETIGAECIAAAQMPSMANAANALLILVHAKKEPSGFTCSVRAMNPAVCRAIAQELQQLLS